MYNERKGGNIMRELKELIELLDWTNDSDYNYLINKKCAYLKHPTEDDFYDLQKSRRCHILGCQVCIFMW